MTLDRKDDDAAFDRGRAVRFAFMLVACSVGVAASAESRLADDPRLAAVLGTDRDFAALAQEKNLRAAFDRFLASDAVLLRPLPEPGREWLASHEVASGKYDWSPVGAIVSCDGSLAVTIGRWQYVSPQGGAMAAGEYLTAWRRSPEGDWQIVLDQAVDLEPLDGVAQGIQARIASSCPRRAPSMRTLDATERRANAALRSGSPAGSAGWTVRHVGTVTGEAHSDLVVTYGVVAEPGGRAAPGASRAVYVRLWQPVRAGWTPVLEVVSAIER